MAKKKSVPIGGGIAEAVNLAEVERLLAFMQKHSLEEFEYQQSDFHIRLRKAALAQPAATTPSPVPVPLTAYSPAPTTAVPATAQSSSPPAEAAAHPAGAAATTGEDLHVVKSPIVGTFYASPTPDAGPFVTVGSRVQAGQVLCIIEAMKLMNEIEADAAGEVARVFVENGHPVEYGQPLFGIRTTGKK